ncbi:MAG: hypothetical protein HYS25_15320 [Ignavibacteriales bacterium]|nr:hypothetical protein [Ignavibacteriales bacterium]
MSKYVLNPKLKQSATEEIFNLLLSFIQIGKSYKTLSGGKTHKIIKVKGEVTIERTDANDKPEINFDEINKVIKLFKDGDSYNTSSEEYKKQLLKPIHKTPLLSILLASDIIVKK